MYKKLIIYGTPKNLAVKIDQIQLHRYNQDQNLTSWYIPEFLGRELPDSANPVYVQIDIGNQREYFSVSTLPEGTSLVELDIDDNNWPLIEKNWNDLWSELASEGWIKEGETPREKFKPGRPRLEANIWAYNEVHIHGREPRDVFPEWKKRLGSGVDQLVNPEDSFQKAIKIKKKK